MAKIAFMGLGAMGSRMAGKLLQAGHDLTVWNRDPGKTQALGLQGARIAGTPRAAAMGAQFVISMVRDIKASRHVWLDEGTGALKAMAADSIAIECATLTPAWIETLGLAMEGQGVRLVDAPVAGSRPQAEAAHLIFFASGEAAALKEVSPILQAMGATVHQAGKLGSGTLVKLAVNALFGSQVAAVAELFGLLQSHGLDMALATEIIGSTPVASPAAKAALASMLAGNFKPMFPVELVEKDFAYVQTAAEATRQSVPISSAVRTVMAQAMARGYGDEHLTGVVRLYQRQAN